MNNEVRSEQEVKKPAPDVQPGQMHPNLGIAHPQQYPQAWGQFQMQMRGKQLSRQLLTDAWLWFLAGWNARGREF